jgi:hypothetical protein
MAVFASAAEPHELASRVVSAIKCGAIAAWELTSGHLRHADLRGEGRHAFFRMTVTGSTLKFVLVDPKNQPGPFDPAAYAYHHGRLTELLLGHFSDAVTRVQSTPFPGWTGAR